MANRGFFNNDDYDDNAETNLGNGPAPVQPPQRPPRPGPSYHDDEGPTILPGGPGRGASSGRPGYDDLEKTHFPQSSNNNYQQQGYVDDYVEETLLGEEDQDVEPLGLLVVKRPLARRGDVYKITKRATIGGKQGEIRLSTDRRVSTPHARIRVAEDAETRETVFVLVDMDSRNGTWINEAEKPLIGQYHLQQGDEIRIGDHVFVFLMLKE
jgi:hypothetical protein